MISSRGMGAMNPSKMGKPKKMKRNDDTDFTEYKKGGWVKGATKNKGALHREMGVPENEKIPAKKLAKATKAEGKLGKRARLAETLKGFKK